MATDIELPPYRIRANEYAAFNLHFLVRHYRSWKSWLVFVPAPLFVAVMIFLTSDNLAVEVRLGVTLAAFVLAFIVSAILMQGCALARCLLRFGKQPIGQAEIRVSLTDEHFISALPQQEGRYKWAGLHDVVRSGKLSLVYVHPHMAVIIPDRIFSDEVAVHTFFDEAYDRWTRAKATAGS
ncbi:YcxB family protein [Asticcacaulis sp.]|uniref:YcxB family protein n=1 Tax=Asticcacaulis sp. TaxID=1872648 RepID=UPI0026224FBF|nr:YcxB family protein [Asticcacaulis sp.]